MAVERMDGAGTGSADIAAHLWTFLDRLSPVMYNRLYASPASCLSIFRYAALPALDHCSVARPNASWDCTDAVTARCCPTWSFADSLLPLSARHIVLDFLWYEEIVRVRDVALWVRERRSEGAEKGERRSVPAPRSLHEPDRALRPFY